MVNSPHAPLPRTDRKRAVAVVIAVVTIVAVTVAIVRLANAQDSSNFRPTTGNSPSPNGQAERAAENLADAKPAATAYGHCNVGYDDSFDEDHNYYNRALATVSIRNTGNIGITGAVSVEFPQDGSDPIEYSSLVELHVDEGNEVHFDEPIATDQIDLFNATDQQCEYRIEILDTFGEVED